MMADICLILEGTFPYITGGVSSCICQLIERTPHLTYDILYIGAKDSPFKEYKYSIPKNVENIKEVYLFDHDLELRPLDLGFNLDKDLVFSLLESIDRLENFSEYFDEIYNKYFHPLTRVCDPYELFNSKQLWDVLESFYRKNFNITNAPSFIDFFYNFRFTLLPIFKILTTDIPRANLYHTLSTGYAGLLGSIAKTKNNRPLFLTEHGVYTHEREIEISQSDWIFDFKKGLKAEADSSIFRKWWVKTFHFLSKITYDKSDVISTLYYGNKEKQIKYGADESKIQIIPNGIEVEEYSQLEKKKNSKIHIALVGRVVPIKDIKTFIKSVKIVSSKVKDLEVSILGPFEEDLGYFEECKSIVQILDLDEVIKFTGKVDVKTWYPKIDLLVLSSISEGQPIVILEAFSCRIPVVSTDVGSCREMIVGGDDIGKAGEVVPFGDAELLANGIIECIESEDRLQELGENAFKRVNAYYREASMLESYNNVYNELLNE